MKFSQIKTRMKEAATLKSRALSLMRDITEILKDKSLPAALRSEIEGARAALRKTWKELADDAQGPVEKKAREAGYSEVIKKEDDEIVLYAKDKKKVIARFPFGKGKKYADEEAARDAAWKQETKLRYATKESENGSSAPVAPIAADIELTAELELDLEECDDENSYAAAPAPWGAKSFTDLNAARAAQEATGLVHELTFDLQTIIQSIVGDPTSTDKVSELRVAFDEFISLVSDAMGANLEAAEAEPISLSGEFLNSGTLNVPSGERLAESNGGALALVEADMPLEVPNARSPLQMDVRLITPGWGNSRDKHYYGRDILERDAKVFEGVKMYTTDHRDAEKSVRTEVAQIQTITGFTADGAPIARVNIFDPAFAEQTRNRAKSNALKSLECSILAYGEAKPGTAPDGRKGNIVTKITQAQSVDWVTKAGAGGYALRLAESEQGANPMDRNKIIELLGKSALPEAARKRLAEREYADEAALSTAITAESDYLKALAEVASPETPAAPVTLAEADVKAALAKLPIPSQKRLAEGKYKDKAELETVIKAEISYLKEVTGSGKPVTAPAAAFGNGGTRPKTLAETNKTVDAVVARGFGVPARKEK